jgi:hypothetical protein
MACNLARVPQLKQNKTISYNTDPSFHFAKHIFQVSVSMSSIRPNLPDAVYLPTDQLFQLLQFNLLHGS